ncbi:Ig-like domain-containing protein, partial [Pseudomonas syringae]|nr:Ig-like domain-containing protein [Pseudomonas syringae]
PTVGGGGGGGRGIGGQSGATGGSAGTYTPTSPSANTGGNGAGFNTVYMGGKGGNSSGGGAGGLGVSGYTNGGAGGTATSGGRTIGGGGGGSGFDANGGRGGSATGGIYNASTGTLAIIGTSTISNNIGAGGGGGGGGTVGGNGGRGIGAIWNKGTLNITSANNSAMSGNVGGSGSGGQATSGGTNGSSPTAVNNIFNDGGSLNVAYSADTTAPTGTSIVIANTSLSSGGTSLVTFTFSEPVFGLEISEITVPNGTLSNLVTTNNITWTATLTASSDISDNSNAISLPLSAVQDSAGNIGTGTVTSNNYAVSDTVAPTVTVVVADTALAAGETSLVTITFSEVVTGFDNADISVANGTLSTVTSSDGGKTWTATLTPTANLTSTVNQISLNRAGMQDLSGNAGSGTATSNNYAIDTSRPTATIVLADSALSIGETSQVTITFSEAVSGFTNADLTVVNGTLSTVTTSNNIVWTATFTPTNNITDSTNVITLANTGVTDAAGNTGSGTTTSNNYAIDTQRPTASILVADAGLTAGETSLVTITFSEAVSGFTNADLTVPNGTLSTVTSSDGGITWTATYTPNNNINDTTNVISLNNSGVTDLAGNAGSGTSNSGNFTIDTVRPSGTVVVADSALSAGETSLVTITFSEAVSGFTNADLTVANGTLSAVSSSDGGVTWTATFTPTANVTDTTNLITLDASGVANASGNAGTGTVSSNNYAIDTQRPTASIVVADNALAIGETSLVTITFSEAVTGFTNADLTINNGTLSAVSSSDGGVTWTATLTPTAGITSNSNSVTLNNGGVTDQAGNAGSGLSSSNNYAIDTVRPTASITMSDNALTAGETSLVTITFSEAVSGFTNADLSVPNGTLSAVSSSDGGITWTATYTPNANVADTTNVITLNNTGVTDLAGNIGSGTTDSGNFTISTQQPTATIVVADSALSVGETSLVTITFSEAVSGFNNADLTVENGSLSAVSSSDGGITWTATFTPNANVTDASNLITLDNTGFANGSGVTGSGTTSSNNYAIDTLRPTATIVVADTALSVGETSLVTITFSEAVSGFSNADLVVANGTLSAVSSSDGGLTWTATLTPSAGITDSSNLVTLNNAGVTDQAGNAGTGLTLSNNYAIDSARPTASIVVADNALSIGETSLVTITFSEAVSGFTNADLSIANGTLSTVSSSDGGITWTATFTPTINVADSTNLITLDNTGVADLAGNTGSGVTNSNNYSIDTIQPTATIVVADSALSVGETSLVTITFSEAVSGFNNADLTVENGTLSAVSSSDGGITWTATFTPTANVTDASNLVTLDNTGFTNASGNTGSGVTSSNNYAIDTLRPTATIVVADNALAVGETSLVTITFSEAVSGFSNADLNIANGTLSAVSSSDGGITWTATLTPTAGITDSSNLVTLNNAGVTDQAGNAGTGLTFSNNYAIDSARPTASIVVADNALSIGETSLVTITFSEAVSGFTNADLSIANGTLSAVSSSDGGITWTATLTPTINVADSTNLITLNNTGVADLAGNTGSGITNSNNYSIDTVQPTATIVVADSALSVGETSLVTITFSEAVSGFNNADLTVENGTLSAVSSSDGGITWTATFTPTANVTDASNLVTLDNTGFTNASGNTGSGTTASNNYAIDTLRPTATIVVADNALAIGETSLVTITFSEAVSGFSNADLNVSNGTLSAVSSNDGGITWTATLTPTAGITSASNSVVLNNGGVTDLAGNAGNGLTLSNNYSVDSASPTATIVMADNTLSIGETSLVTITFSEAVNGFDNSDLSVPNGTLSAVSSSDGGITWTATFTPNANVADTSNLISLNNAGVNDLAGNSGVGTTASGNFSVDTIRPSATIVMADNALSAGETSLVTITFSQAVNGFSNADLTVANGTLSAVSSSDGGVTWTATFTPAGNVTDATNLITLDNTGVTNASGNAGSGTTASNNYVIDTQRPTATIVVADSLLSIGETSRVTITFSEAVSGFSNADLTVANGTLSAVSSTDGGITWTATLTPNANAASNNNVVTLNNSGIADLAGNAGSGTTQSNSYAIDLARPTASVVVADNALSAGETSQVTITFSEAVNGFSNTDLTVANGTLSAVSSSDGGITWTATLTPDANITAANNFIVLDSGRINDLAGNAGTTVALSSNYSIDNQRPTATVSIANPNLATGQTSLVTFAFSEPVNNFTLSDISVANGTLSNLASSDGGATWTATLTPTANVTDPSNFIVLDSSTVTDRAGNAGTGIALSPNYAITTTSLTGDPQFRIDAPAPLVNAPNLPLQPALFGPPTGNLGSPLSFSPLFEQRTTGGDLPPVGNIFITNRALAPSFIAQVFDSSSVGGPGSGFTGFNSGEGSVFGTSTLSTLFSRESATDSSTTGAFGSAGSNGLRDSSQSIQAGFGALTLGQQLQQITDNEQEKLRALAWALGEVGVSEVQA